MKKIILKEMHLVNFKGISSLDICFDENETTILGANHSGKTSTFDAFIWLLFGKDSQDRKDFQIKTYDKSGNIIPKLPHEVSAVLNVDGYDVSLRRVYTEVWAKERGNVIETLKSNKTETYIDDVPMKISEYKERVDAIFDEGLFRLITDPLYFTSQKWDVQRRFLFEMAGEITNQEILESYPQAADIINQLTGKTIEDLQREIACKKKIIKEKMNLIPVRRDEVSRGIVEDRDWDKLQSEIKGLEEEIVALDSQTAMLQEANAAVQKRNNEIYANISELRNKQAAIRNEITNRVLSGYYERRQAYEENLNKKKSLEISLTGIKSRIELLDSNLSAYNNQRTDLLAEYHNLSDQSFDTSKVNVVCPTCNRPLDPDEAEDKIAEMLNAFNERKAKALEANKANGLKVKENIEKCLADLQELIAKKDSIEAQLAEIGTPTFTETMPDATPEIEKDARIIEIETQLSVARQELESPNIIPANNDIASEKAQKQAALNELNREFALKGVRIDQLQRIAALDEELRSCSDALAQLEGVDEQILRYNQVRADLIEQRINSYFRIVRFKLFETQINGNTVECCEATADGVPFSTKSTSEQINMGLDIINAICTKYELSAPIFIDNRECITSLLPMKSQIINLKVDENHKSLFIL